MEYKLVELNNDETIGIFNFIEDCILNAARYDGYGAIYQRDENENMRLFSSPRHIGNNPYFPKKGDEFPQFSSLTNDENAISELAENLYASGCFHSNRNFNFEIIMSEI